MNLPYMACKANYLSWFGLCRTTLFDIFVEPFKQYLEKNHGRFERY